MTSTLQTAKASAPSKTLGADGIDFYSDSFIYDTYRHYARLRTTRPIAFVEALNAWFLTRHSDVKSVLNDERFGIDFERLQINRMGPNVVNEDFFRFGREFMAFADAPYHTKIKGLFVQGFTRARAEAQLPMMKRIIDEVIDEFIDDKKVDLAKHFAHEVPLRIISTMLGVSESDRARLQGWIEDYNPVIGFPPMTIEQTRKANAATLGFEEYFRAMVLQRRVKPGDDLLSEMLNRSKTLEIELDEFQIVANLILLYFAGQDTQKGHLGNIVVALHQNPEQLAWLLEKPDRVWQCTHELMRFDSISQITGRVALENLEIDGVAITKGQTILLGIGAANRDPAVFTDPDRLDLQRVEARNNVTFGAGRHACLGSGIARLSVPLMLVQLLSRIPTLRVDLTNLQRNRTLSKRGYGSIPATW